MTKSVAKLKASPYKSISKRFCRKSNTKNSNLDFYKNKFNSLAGLSRLFLLKELSLSVL